MIRYRIIQKDIVCDGMMHNDAMEALLQIQDANPKSKYDIEEYDYTPAEGKGLGRDPALH